MKGKKIVVTGSEGQYLNAVADVALLPGDLVEISGVDSENNFNVDHAAPGGNGQRSLIAVVDLPFQGGVNSDTIPAGDLCRVYIPLPGDQINVRVKTAAVTTVGGMMILENDTGKLIATTGTPEQEPFVALEAKTSAANDLVHMIRA